MDINSSRTAKKCFSTGFLFTLIFFLLNFLHLYLGLKEFSSSIIQLFEGFTLCIYALYVIDWKSREMSICKEWRWNYVTWEDHPPFAVSRPDGSSSLLSRWILEQAVMILTKWVYHIESFSFTQTLRSRHAEEKSTLNSGFFLFSRGSKKFTLLV